MILFVMHWIYTAANKRCRKHWHDHNRNNYIFVFISIKEFKITFVLFCFAVTLYSHDKCKPIAVLDQSMGTCTLKLQTLCHLKTFSSVIIASCLFTRLFLLSAGCSRSRDKTEGLFLDSVLFLWVSL